MICRVSLQSDALGSIGFEFYGSARAARDAVRAYIRASNQAGDHDATARIDTMPTPQTKQQVIDLLNVWGGHPDNG